MKKTIEKYDFINDMKATPFEKEYVIVRNVFIESFSGAINERYLEECELHIKILEYILLIYFK